MKPRLRLTFSMADQNFAQTKSVGLLNMSVQLFDHLARRPEFERLTLLTNRTLPAPTVTSPRVAVEFHEAPVRSRWGRILWDQWGLYRAARRAGNDWLFLPKGFASFCRACPVKLVSCVADANHDYYQRHYPGVVPSLEMSYFMRSVKATIRDSDLIVTISDFTTQEVVRMAKDYGLRCPPVRTIGIGFHPAAVTAAQKQDRVLVLAGRWPHKRTDLAVEFLSRWQKQTQFPGSVEWVGRIPEAVAFPDFPRWIRHPRLPEERFRTLLAEARALVYFSGYEGFGMPPVEAAIAGTCPVYSRLDATAEVMAGAGKAFDNADFDSFAAAMDGALVATSAQIQAWAEDLLRRHDWAAVADRFVRFLSEPDDRRGQAGRGAEE